MNIKFNNSNFIGKLRTTYIRYYLYPYLKHNDINNLSLSSYNQYKYTLYDKDYWMNILYDNVYIDIDKCNIECDRIHELDYEISEC